MTKHFFNFLMLFGATANALVGIEGLESRLSEKNQELSSLRQQVESKEALCSSSIAGFLPTLNAVGVWAQNKTDDLATIEKGYIGYIEGRYNLFNGFKDQSLSNQKEIDLKLARIELESKQRELRLTLTEVASDMVLLHKLQSILDEEYNTTQIQNKMAAKKVAAGLTGAVDNLEFNLRESEIKIEKNQIDQLHKEAHQKLIKLYGEDLPDSELSQISFSNIESLVNQTKKFSLENNLEYQKSDLVFAKALYSRSEVRSDYLPKLDFTFNVGRLTPNENSPAQYNESKYYITLIVPLFSGFDTFNKTKSASFQASSAEKLKTQKINDVQSDFNILKNKAIELSELFKINESKIVNSQEYFDLTLGEYKRGIKNSPDLVTATERLFSTKKKRYELLKELELLKVKIDNI